MRRRVRRFALGVGFVSLLACLHGAQAAHATIGMPVADAEMPTLAGGVARPLGDAEVNVLVFFRTHQERSVAALRELARCRNDSGSNRVRWVGIVSDSLAAESVAALVRDSGLALPVLVDRADALYGSLGVALHPVVVIVDRNQRLAAFEPYRSLDFCTVVTARVRHVLGEISDDELRAALDPPRSAQGGADATARRYRALAEAQLKAGNFDKALESVRMSIDRDPALAPAHAVLGEVLLAQGNCDAAVVAFARALALDASIMAAKAGIERCGRAR